MLTGIELPCFRPADPRNKGCALPKSATVYRSLSLVAIPITRHIAPPTVVPWNNDRYDRRLAATSPIARIAGARSQPLEISRHLRGVRPGHATARRDAAGRCRRRSLRAANAWHQQSPEGRLDHRDWQRAHQGTARRDGSLFPPHHGRIGAPVEMLTTARSGARISRHFMFYADRVGKKSPDGSWGDHMFYRSAKRARTVRSGTGARVEPALLETPRLSPPAIPRLVERHALIFRHGLEFTACIR